MEEQTLLERTDREDLGDLAECCRQFFGEVRTDLHQLRRGNLFVHNTVGPRVGRGRKADRRPGCCQGGGNSFCQDHRINRQRCHDVHGHGHPGTLRTGHDHIEHQRMVAR